MASKPIIKPPKAAKRRSALPANRSSADKSGEPRSKLLKYDTAVPGDRGAREKESSVQGSE